MEVVEEIRIRKKSEGDKIKSWIDFNADIFYKNFKS